MTTSPKTAFLSEILDSNKQIPAGKLAYFRARLKNRFHEVVLNHFAELKLNKADLARKLGKKPEQITRWLGSPGNWTLDTLSDLLLGMGYEPSLSTKSLFDSTAKLQSETPRLSAALLANSAQISTEKISNETSNFSGLLQKSVRVETTKSHAILAVRLSDQDSPFPHSLGKIADHLEQRRGFATYKTPEAGKFISGIS